MDEGAVADVAKSCDDHGDRTKLINSVRGMVKSLGVMLLSGLRADVFAYRATDFLEPQELNPVD